MTDFHAELTDEFHNAMSVSVELLDDVDDFLADVHPALPAFEQNRALELRRRIEEWFTGERAQ